MSDITTKVRNYNGKNSFINKMKDSLNKYGSLTPKQRSAVEKILSAPVESKMVEMTDDMKKIASYEGTNSFVNEIKSKLAQYGSLTDKQVSSAISQIDKEMNKPVVRNVNIPAVGDTIKIGRSIGESLKEKHDLKFNPILIDVTKVLSFTAKAVKFSGKLTSKKGSVCTCCARTLTDEFSMLTGVGKICAKNLGIEYITNSSQVEKFREDYLKKIEEIGEMEFWVPRSQIKNWDGKFGGLMDVSNHWFKK
jgi:hypothetical protein